HAVGDARFSPDGAEIIALTRNIAGYPYRTPVVLNAEDHEDHRVLGGHRGAVLGLDVSPDGARVVTASEDGTARIWGANPRVDARFTSVLDGAPMRIQLSRDGAIQVYYDAADRAIKVHAMEGKGGASAEPSVPSPSAAYELALRSDGGQVAVAVAAEIALLEPSARAPARRWGINKGLRHLEYSADGTRLVGSFLGHVVIWNPATGAVVTDVDRRYARATIFAPDSTTRMASWSDASPEVTLWDAGTGETLHTLTHGEAIRTAAFAPSGDDLVVVTEANHMHLWDTRDGRARRRVGSAALAVSQIAIDPRGQWFVAACDDSTARIGSLGASEPGERDDTQVVLRGHTEPIVALAISPDGARVLTGSADQTARVWDTKSWRTIAVIKHRASLADVAFSSDSERTITISTDGALQVWSAKVPSDALRRELWAATRACPSIADREEYLSADHETAEIDARRCEAMVRCVHDREPGEYERCLAEFRRAQAAGAAFRAPDAVARAP
ncbi:MAG: WD40 repeat domain-containing protein, partial [Myxococcales bacterium]|nr:WD40 repeat domain-containing protein [Myxococcales bacterium]